MTRRDVAGANRWRVLDELGRFASRGVLRVALKRLVGRANHGGVVFDRAWTFRYDDPGSPDVAVEITRLERPA